MNNKKINFQYEICRESGAAILLCFPFDFLRVCVGDCDYRKTYRCTEKNVWQPLPQPPLLQALKAPFTPEPPFPVSQCGTASSAIEAVTPSVGVSENRSVTCNADTRLSPRPAQNSSGDKINFLGGAGFEPGSDPEAWAT